MSNLYSNYFYKMNSTHDIINERNYVRREIKEIKGNQNINPEDIEIIEDLTQIHEIKVRNQRSMNFVGTSEYISPEVIADKQAEFGTDIWAFGVILYQMIFNMTPFYDSNNYLTFRKIESANFDFPKDSNDISDEAKDLLKKILVVDPNKRLGGGQFGSELDISHLKKHLLYYY